MEKILLRKLAKSSIAIATSAVIFAGCGGGGGESSSGGSSSSSSSSSSSTPTYSGTVADGYISGATVCLDLDNDGTCGVNEPTGTTNSSGSYSISTTATIPAGTKIIAYGGTDTFTNAAFVGTLKSPVDLKDGTKNHISPLTTLVSAYVDDGKTLADVASDFVLDADAIKGDMFSKLSSGTNTEKAEAAKAIKQAYIIQKTLELTNADYTDIIGFSGLKHNTDINLGSLSQDASAQNVIQAIKDTTIDANTTVDALKTKQKAIDIIKEIVIADGITTINGTLLQDLETAIGTKNVDVKAMALVLKDGTTLPNEAITYGETTSTTKTVVIDFDAMVGNEKLMCSEVVNEVRVAKQYTLGKENTATTIADFRYFVSNIKLKLSDNTTAPLKLFTNNFQYQVTDKDVNVAILDFEDKTGNCYTSEEINKKLVGTIPTTTATVTGIEFTVGVPLELNHIQFPDSPALTKTAMAWSWQAGRKFTKLETQPVAGLNSYNANTSAWTNSLTGKFTMHLGSTGCTATEQMFKDGQGQECAQPNRVDLKFTAFNPEIQKIVLDYAPLLTFADVSKNYGGAAGCMSGLTDPECMSTGNVAGSMFKQIGLDDVGAIGKCIGDDCTTNQKLFSVQSK